MDSGNLAEFDEDGISSVGGRTKDMIIQGGENNFPREVEECLIRHPKVSDLQVFGIPVEKLGEPVYALIVAKPGTEVAEAELREITGAQLGRAALRGHLAHRSRLDLRAQGVRDPANDPVRRPVRTCHANPSTEWHPAKSLSFLCSVQSLALSASMRAS